MEKRVTSFSAPTPEQERKDMLSYVDELSKRTNRFGRRAAIPEGEQWSVEWFEQVGKFWHDVRESREISSYEAAFMANAHVNEIRLIENGAADPEEIRSDLLKRYAQALDPEGNLYDEFRQRFGLAQDSPSA